MINLKNIAIVQQGLTALKTVMEAGGMPESARLKKVVVMDPPGLGGLLFIMEDGSEWVARVTLTKRETPK
jgi:hypothetical protein